jgi:Protein of unknown function (DUF3105)
VASQKQRRTARYAERQLRQRRRWVLGALGMLVVFAIGGLVNWGLTRESPGREVPTLGNQHIASPDTPHRPYNTRPPTSGPHLESLARWGIHSQPIPDELQVHNLEDGGVLVQYNCRECEELVAKLRAIVSRFPDRVILAPYPHMDTRIALTAWGRIDTLETFDEQRIVRFIEAYRGIDHHLRSSGGGD